MPRAFMHREMCGVDRAGLLVAAAERIEAVR
jgi:hypothetical protein